MTSFFGRTKYPSWWPFDQSLTTFTHRGRDAVWHALSVLKLKPGDRVLVPSYHCGSEVDVLIKAGLDVQLYQVDHRGRVNEDDLLGRLQPDVKMVYVIHLFGWPQIFQRVRRAALERRIPVIEDCALSLFSKHDNLPIGSGADCAIFSFPKSLGVPDGGALVLRQGPSLTERQFRAAPPVRILRRSLSLLKSRVRSTCRMTAFRLKPRLLSQSKLTEFDLPNSSDSDDRPDIPSSYYFNPGIANCRISRISQKILCAVNPDTIVRRRRKNYLWLAEQLSEVDGIEIWQPGLEDGICPLVMPILVDNSQCCASYLQRVGISATAWWWGFHKALDYSEFTQSRILKSRVVALPIHQELNERHLKYVVAAVRAYQGLKSASELSSARQEALIGADQDPRSAAERAT